MSTRARVITALALLTCCTLTLKYYSSLNDVKTKSIKNFPYEESSIRRNLASAIHTNSRIDTKSNLPQSFKDLKKSSKLEDFDGKQLSELILSTKNETNSIYHFVKTHLKEINQDVLILHWDSDGILDEYSMTYRGHTHRHWWQAHVPIDKTKPSEYGTVALLLVTDRMSVVPWLIIPPVPLIVYTIPNEINDTYHRIIPTHYDRTGFSRDLIRVANEAMSNSTFYERKNVIVWRGETHRAARNRNTAAQMSNDDPNKEWLDAAITNNETHMSMEEMATNYKYQLDIGGVSGTSWGGLRWKMCTGNLVFKVNSWTKDWWHDMIEPYVHYIPVKQDLSDLRQVYEWAESHPEDVDNIRTNGMAKCQETITVEAINSFETKVFQELQSSSKEIVDEVQLFQDGLLSFTT